MSDKDEEIKTTYLNSTRAQRRLWVNLLARETERTGEQLKLSDWIIRHLPQPGTDLTEFVDSRREYVDGRLPKRWREYNGTGQRHFVYMDSVIINQVSDSDYVFSADSIDQHASELEHLEVIAYKWFLS